jgi:hypothetical protein
VLPLLDELGHGGPIPPDGARGVSIGPDAERIRVLQVEQIGDLVEPIGNLSVVGGYSRSNHSAPDRRRN